MHKTIIIVVVIIIIRLKRRMVDATIQPPSESFVEVEHDTIFASNGNSEKIRPQMGFEPTTLRDHHAVRESNKDKTYDSYLHHAVTLKHIGSLAKS